MHACISAATFWINIHTYIHTYAIAATWHSLDQWFPLRAPRDRQVHTAICQQGQNRQFYQCRYHSRQTSRQIFFFRREKVRKALVISRVM